MGRPYSEELDAVPLTYAWASRSPIGDLAALVRKCARRPLYAVGSGGSFTAATLASALHQQGGRMSMGSVQYSSARLTARDPPGQSGRKTVLRMPS